MRFGSVEFFKVLIKTVLAIVFFAPLIIAVIFGVLLLNKNKQLDDATKRISELNAYNAAIDSATEVLVGERIGTAEDYCILFEKSGVSYDDLMKLLYQKGKLDAQSVYNILSHAGVSDKDLLSTALNKNGEDSDSLYATLKGAGLSDKQIAEIGEIAKKASTSSNRPILSTPNDNSSTASEPTNSNTSMPQSTTSSITSTPSSTTSTPSSPTSDVTSKPYMNKYPDMYVDAPTNYVREDKTVYLTFDDGPSANVYSIIEYILKKHDVKATFFVVTDPNQNPNLEAKLKYIADNGHAIGIHSASHDYEKIYASVDAFLDDFYSAWMTIYNATGIKTEIFRFPGGSNTDYNAEIRDEIIAEMTRRGFRFYDWNVQSNDIAGYNWTDMYNTVLTAATNSNRSIVLFHDRSDTGVTVLEDIIVKLQEKGYKLDKINDDTMPIQFVGPFS